MGRDVGRLQVEVFSYRELEHYAVGIHEGLLLIVDEERWPGRLPDGFQRLLRLRISLTDIVQPSLLEHEALLRHAQYALNFARLHGPSLDRIAVGSPEGEVRAPGLALGLITALELPSARGRELAERYPRLSTTLRDRVLEAAGMLPPTPLEKAAHSPLTKAALLLLARFTEGRFHS